MCICKINIWKMKFFICSSISELWLLVKCMLRKVQSRSIILLSKNKWSGQLQQLLDWSYILLKKKIKNIYFITKEWQPPPVAMCPRCENWLWMLKKKWKWLCNIFKIFNFKKKWLFHTHATLILSQNSYKARKRKLKEGHLTSFTLEWEDLW